MKFKKLIVMMSVCVLGISALTGCGSKETTTANNDKPSTEETDKNKDTETDEDTDEKGYVFESNGVEIVVDMDMSTIADDLGEPDSYFEEPSCAAQGIAKIYTYPGYEIETYPDGDKDLVACVVLKDDSVATPEGIDLSMTKDDIIDAYGSDYEESDRSMVYEKNGTKLCFILMEMTLQLLSIILRY